MHDGARVLDGFDAPLATHVQAGLERAGVTVLPEDAVTQVTQSAQELTYRLKSGAEGQADRVEAAIGRTPNTDCFGAVTQRLERASSGALALDAWLQTSVLGIYAIGDVADRLPLTPVATAHGVELPLKPNLFCGKNNVSGSRERVKQRIVKGVWPSRKLQI